MNVFIVSPGYDTTQLKDFDVTRQRIDKIFLIRDKLSPPKTSEACDRLKETVQKFKDVHRDVQEKEIDCSDMETSISELLKIFRELSPDDVLYFHMNLGIRHVTLAFLYASFFIDNEVYYLVPTGGKRLLEAIPKFPSRPALNKPKQIILLNLKSKEKRLNDLASSIKDRPRVLRHLRHLISLNLVEFDSKKKTYKTTLFGKLMQKLYSRVF